MRIIAINISKLRCYIPIHRLDDSQRDHEVLDDEEVRLKHRHGPAGSALVEGVAADTHRGADGRRVFPRQTHTQAEMDR